MQPGAEEVTRKLETILVVDDNALSLAVVILMLERANFQVLSAHSGADAIRMAAETDQEIHLLLADVDMPGMSGPDLGMALKATRPGIRIMLMSGGDNGLLILNYGWAYRPKPFRSARLVEMVTRVLHSEDRSQRGYGFDTRK